MIGLELSFGLLLGLVGTSRITLARLVDALSTAPARIAGITPPTLAADAPAELVLVDPEGHWKPGDRPLASKSRNTPFHGRAMHGAAVATIVGGRLVYSHPEKDLSRKDAKAQRHS